MHKLIRALATTAILLGGSIVVVGKAEAGTIIHVGSLPPLTKSFTPIEKVGYWRRLYRHGYYGYGYPYYGYAYPYYGYGYYRPYPYYGYGYGYHRPYYGYGYHRPYYGYGWRY
jgi:hypothetical protein